MVPLLTIVSTSTLQPRGVLTLNRNEELRRLLDVSPKEKAVRRGTATLQKLLNFADYLSLRRRETVMDGRRGQTEDQGRGS
jgi:hypothetical protein